MPLGFRRFLPSMGETKMALPPSLSRSLPSPSSSPSSSPAVPGLFDDPECLPARERANVLQGEQEQGWPNKALIPHSHGHAHQHACQPPIEGVTSDKDHAHGLARQSFWNCACSCVLSCITDELLLLDIFPFLNLIDLARAAAVCKRWRFLAGDPFLYRRMNFSPLAGRISAESSVLLIKRHWQHVNSLNLSKTRLPMLHVPDLFQAPSPRLKKLHLCGCTSLTDELLHHIVSMCPNLTHLHLCACHQLTSAGIAQLSSLARLEELSLSGCRAVTDEGVLSLPASLVTLNLNGCHRITHTGLATLATRLKGLQELSARGIEVDDNVVHTLSTHCRFLISLTLVSSNPFGGFSRLSDNAASSLHRLRLRKLTILPSKQLSNQFVARAVTPSIEELTLGGSPYITDDSLDFIARTCPFVKTLVLSKCAKVTAAGIVRLASLRHLSFLDIHGCKGLSISEALAGAFANSSAFPALLDLDLSCCRQVETEAVQAIQRARPGLRLIHY